MLNPRAYRAALLEQLTSAAAEDDIAGPPPLEPKAASPHQIHERKGVSDLSHRTSSSQLRLPREPAASGKTNPSNISNPQSTCVIEDSVVRRGQPKLHSDVDEGRVVEHGTASPTLAESQPSPLVPLYTVGHGYHVEPESHRSLILSFIDNCIRAGVPEETIAEQVQFMVASMKESLALHATLHAQRHRERIREYELGALTNMVERQQLELTQQQTQQQQQYQQHHDRPHQLGSNAPTFDAYLSSSPAAAAPAGSASALLQLAPPPPLVYSSAEKHDRYLPSNAFHTASNTYSSGQNDGETAYYDSTAHRPSPRRRAPSPPSSPPHENLPLSHTSAYPTATWRAVGRDEISEQRRHRQHDENTAPSVQLMQMRRVTAASVSGSKKLRADARSSRASSPSVSLRRSRTRSPSSGEEKEIQRSPSDRPRSTKTLSGHHSHRGGHRALCDVCLRNATDEGSSGLEEVDEVVVDEVGNVVRHDRPTSSAHTSDKRRLLNSKRHQKGAAATAAAIEGIRPPATPTHRPTSSSTAAHRHRYQPNGHYMKPTHASLVRRTSSSSTSPIRSRQTPVALTSRRPSRYTSPTSTSAAAPSKPTRTSSGQRKLVVRSTYSSRLRVAASRPQGEQTEAVASETSSIAGTVRGEEKRRGDAQPRAGRRGRDISNRSRSCSGSSTSSSAEDSIYVGETIPAHQHRSSRKNSSQAHQETARRSHKEVSTLDLYAPGASPLSAAGQARVAVAAQTDDATTATPQPSTQWKLSIDPEPQSPLNATVNGSIHTRAQGGHRILHDATTLQWQQAAAPPSPGVINAAVVSDDENPISASVAADQQQPQLLVSHAQNKREEKEGAHAQLRPRRDPPVQPPPSVTTTSASASPTASEAPHPLFPDRDATYDKSKDDRAAYKSKISAPQDRGDTKTAARFSRAAVCQGEMADIDDEDAAVCVTSPELQLFLEASQRKVRETERLLARTPGSALTTPTATTTAATTPFKPSVQRNSSRISTIQLSPQRQWRQQQPQQQQHYPQRPQTSTEELNRRSQVTSSTSLSASPVQRDTPHSMWSDRSVVLDTVREKQQQRLRELRDRLREYDPPSPHEGQESGAMQRAGEITLASGMTSTSTALSQDPRVYFKPHYVVPPASSLENSPLIQISPTSSDDDLDDT